jgi:hypothetical protein
VLEVVGRLVGLAEGRRGRRSFRPHSRHSSRWPGSTWHWATRHRTRASSGLTPAATAAGG